MSEELKGCLIYGAIIVGIIVLCTLFSGEGSSDEYSVSDREQELQDQLDEKEAQVQDYQDALDEANNEINEAKDNAWEDYDTMGETLDDLNEVYEP